MIGKQEKKAKISGGRADSEKALVLLDKILRRSAMYTIDLHRLRECTLFFADGGWRVQRRITRNGKWEMLIRDATWEAFPEDAALETGKQARVRTKFASLLEALMAYRRTGARIAYRRT